jgi:hypothetical protein
VLMGSSNLQLHVLLRICVMSIRRVESKKENEDLGSKFYLSIKGLKLGLL